MGFLDWSPVKATLQFGDKAFDKIGVHDIPFVSNPYTKPTPAPAAPKPQPTTYKPQTAAPVDNSFMQSLNAQIAALQRQLAYTPKLPSFDVMGNYNRARSQAEAAVNPLYDKYLNDFLAQNQAKRVAKQNEVTNTKAGIALDLNQTLAKNAVDRARTGEDLTNALADSALKEGQMQEQTGTQFDADRRALAEQVAGAGLTTSGLGQGQIFDQNNKRNLDEAQQVAEYANQRAAKQLMANRTIEDLARGDKDANDISANKNQAADFDLESYLQGLAGDETNFRNDNEYKRIQDVNNQTNTYAQSGTQSFLQSLAGAGWRPQDIALAYQVYG